MTTVAAVLLKYQVDMSEADVALGLEAALQVLSGSGAAPLTGGEVDYLVRHAGVDGTRVVDSWDPQIERAQRARAAVRAVEELVSTSVGIAQAARMLGVDRSRISHRLSGGALYAVTVGSHRRIPTWQLLDGKELPGLSRVISAIPASAHPLDVAGLMTTPADELAGRTAVEHLSSGGDPGVVVDLVGELGRW